MHYPEISFHATSGLFDFEPINLNTTKTSYSNLSKVNDLLDSHNFASIIRNKELFWLAFCKIASRNKVTYRPVALYCDELTLWFIHDYNYNRLRKAIEKLRSIFNNHFDNKKHFTFSAISHLNGVYFALPSPSIDITSQNKYEIHFNNLIKPNLIKFAESLGCFCKISDYLQVVKEGTSISENISYLISIIWGRIPPLKIADHSFNIADQACDVKLKSAQGIKFVHSQALLLFGGDAFKTMLAAPMKESNAREIDLKLFSHECISDFVDFIYSGHDKVFEKKLSQESFNYFELFCFAHTYLNQPLINCCINWINILAQPADYQYLAKFAEQYDNDDLRYICLELQKEYVASLVK